jgi:hypothetical protein
MHSHYLLVFKRNFKNSPCGLVDIFDASEEPAASSSQHEVGQQVSLKRWHLSTNNIPESHNISRKIFKNLSII